VITRNTLLVREGY